MMGTMIESFGWTASQFWDATLHEVMAAFEARKRVNETISGRN